MARGRTDRVHLYRLDARVALRALRPGSIDVLITDPPYTTVSRNRASGHLRDWFADGLSWRQIGDALALARTRMATDGVAFVMTNSDGLREAIAALERAGFSRVRPITWDKRVPGLGNGLRHQTEYVLVGLIPGSRSLTGSDLVSVAAVGPGTAERYPTQKPDALGRRLAAIARVGPADLVVDPFCGSGALLVGALERGAEVIGADVSARAFRVATARLAGALPKPVATAKPVKGRPPARLGSSLEGRRRGAAPAYRNSARGTKTTSRRRTAR